MIKLPALAGELLEEIAMIPVVDCHEHLPCEPRRVKQTIDVTHLFSHYCRADLIAAGMPMGSEQEEFFNAQKPLLERWRKGAPFVEAIRFGSYAYPAFAYVREVLGIDDITEHTVEEISRRLQADNTPGLLKRLMQDLCRIEISIQCREDAVLNDQPFQVYLCRDKSYDVSHAGALRVLEEATGVDIYSLGDCVRALHAFVAKQKAAGSVGLKVGAAYGRTLEYVDVPASEAEKAFAKLRAGVRSRLSDVETEALENYLLRREVEACIDNDMPVVIHTGYQAGVRNDIRNARATHLWPLLAAYPKARFDLFHGSFPYVSDMTVIGKYFANVSLNMCWMHIMGPEISRRALGEWLDAVPVNKIFAFGGDYSVPEKIYGHLQLARANVATVLAEKVQRGRMNEQEALEVARLLFNENPKRWYRLGEFAATKGTDG